jgi:soluble lytic murein transglycosylase
MRRWIAGALVSWATVAGAVEVPAGNPPQAAQAMAAARPPSLGELAVQLVQREAEIKELKTRLDEVDEQKWLSRAEDLGVVEAMGRYGFTEKQKRRLAVSIVKEAQVNGIDPLLVVAVIRCESSFNPLAESGVGAMGLMQVMPDTGTWLASKRGFDLGRAQNLYDTDLNIELGTAYLAALINQFGTVEHALVAYNAGPGAAKKILANREVKKNFIAGYPKKVVGEFKKLKLRSEQNLAKRLAAKVVGAASGS